MNCFHRMPTIVVFMSATIFVGAAARAADALDLEISVEAGKHDRQDVPVQATLDLPKALAEASLATLSGPGGKTIVGQLTAPGLLTPVARPGAPTVQRELHFILPQLEAGQTASYKVTIGGETSAGQQQFAWKDNRGKYATLRLGETPVLRYIYQAFDDSSGQRRYETYKVFHHLFSPGGERIVTNGPTVDEPYPSSVRYPHHRGIYYGFSKMSYEGVSKADLWHCQGDNYQSHEAFLSQEAGPVLGRHRVAIDWHGKGKETFVKEERELTAYAVPGGTLIEFASRLVSAVGNVKIDGDPQHAGFQFRAHDEVAKKTARQTYYVRPDGKGKPGETRNWPGNKDQVNLPWKAMSFVLGDERYTVAYLDKPTNPKEARFSERDYARFGSYFQTEIDGDETLDVNYRLWLKDGEMTGEEVAAASQDFTEPPKVTVK